MATYRKSVLLRSTRKVARVVDRAALEMRCTGDCTGGSNPSLSARRKGEQSSPGQKSQPRKLACRGGIFLAGSMPPASSFLRARIPRMGITAGRRNPSSRKLACRGWIFGRSDAPGIVFPPCRDPPNGDYGSMPCEVSRSAVIPSPRKLAENK